MQIGIEIKEISMEIQDDSNGNSTSSRSFDFGVGEVCNFPKRIVNVLKGMTPTFFLSVFFSKVSESGPWSK